MSLVGTITSNPDFAVLVTAGVGYLGRMLQKRAKAVTDSELWDTMLKVAYQAFPGLFKDARLFDDEHVREVISKTIWRGLGRIEVPRNATTEKLVAEVVEHAVGELAMMITKQSFGEFLKIQSKTLEIIKAAPPDVAIEPAP